MGEARHALESNADGLRFAGRDDQQYRVLGGTTCRVAGVRKGGGQNEKGVAGMVIEGICIPDRVRGSLQSNAGAREDISPGPRQVAETDRRRTRLTRLDVVGALGVGIMSLSGIAFMGYVLQEPVLYSWGLAEMALLTSLALIATGVALYQLSRQCERRG